jgi:hypothetical protein
MPTRDISQNENFPGHLTQPLSKHHFSDVTTKICDNWLGKYIYALADGDSL